MAPVVKVGSRESSSKKPTARLLFVLRRDKLRVKTVCKGEDGKNPQWFASRQTLIRYDQQESAMIRR